MSLQRRDAQQRPARAWYREPYVWLMITFPALAVIGGLTTIAIAIVSDDGLVVDDYYQRGKQINRVLQRDRAAGALQLAADMSIDAQNTVHVALRARPDAVLPEQISLGLAFATSAGKDHAVTLRRVSTSGGYTGQLQRPLTAGRWYAELQTEQWRLVSVLQAPLRQPLQFRVKP